MLCVNVEIQIYYIVCVCVFCVLEWSGASICCVLERNRTYVCCVLEWSGTSVCCVV